MKAEGQGFKLIMGLAMFFTVFLVWIPLNQTVSDVADVFNAQTTDSDTIARNNMAVDMFNSLMIFMLIAIGIWIFKTAREGSTSGYVIE